VSNVEAHIGTVNRAYSFSWLATLSDVATCSSKESTKDLQPFAEQRGELMSSRLASDRIIDVLVDAGITHMFGLPGGNTMELWKALHGREHQVRAIVPRDEQTASCMADMYGKMTGKPGVFSAQGVFAGSTGLFGVIESFLSHSPMLVLSEMSEVDRFLLHGPIQGATGHYGSIDLPSIFRSVTKYTAVAHYPHEAVVGTQLAIKHALAQSRADRCSVP
jgi:thiamine pyrophosphate-dependent acetolactate synthase large subunit-like protein